MTSSISRWAAWLFGERYGSGPPWRVTRRWLPGGVSRGGDRSPEGATGQAGGWRDIRLIAVHRLYAGSGGGHGEAAAASIVPAARLA